MKTTSKQNPTIPENYAKIRTSKLLSEIEMRREIPVNETKFTPLDRCLSEWSRYQRRDDARGGYRCRDSILESDGAADFEQLVDRVDNDVAMAVDAMVNSLTTHHAWAIKLKCGIATVWRFAQLEYDKTRVAAEDELTKKLKRNSVTANFFIA